MLFIVRVRSYSKKLPYVKLAKDKVFVFVVLRKNAKIMPLSV